MEFDKWIKRGDWLGLKPETLMAFVKEQQAAAKGEKAWECEKRQTEHEERKEEAEHEERKEEAEHEGRKEEAECEA